MPNPSAAWPSPSGVEAKKFGSAFHGECVSAGLPDGES
jgi:hypothetical protein